MLAGGAPNLTINIQSPDVNLHYQVVEFLGDFDKVGFDAIRDSLEALSQNFHEQYLVFNFSGLNFINSEGIGFLMMLHAHLSKKQKSLVITGIDKHVKEVFSVIGIFSVLKTYDSVPAFLQNLSSHIASV